MKIHINITFCRKIWDESEREKRDGESFYMPIFYFFWSAVICDFHLHALMRANSSSELTKSSIQKLNTNENGKCLFRHIMTCHSNIPSISLESSLPSAHQKTFRAYPSTQSTPVEYKNCATNMTDENRICLKKKILSLEGRKEIKLKNIFISSKYLNNRKIMFWSKQIANVTLSQDRATTPLKCGTFCLQQPWLTVIFW